MTMNLAPRSHSSPLRWWERFRSRRGANPAAVSVAPVESSAPPSGGPRRTRSAGQRILEAFAMTDWAQTDWADTCPDGPEPGRPPTLRLDASR
jgi:hypothetical protein